jgi:hypothetical protein
LLARIPRFIVLFRQAGIEKWRVIKRRPEQATDIGNAVVIPVDLATLIRPPRLDSNSSLMSGTSVGHLPSVALIPSHTATTKAGYDDRDESALKA